MSEATLVKENECSIGTVYVVAAPEDAPENMAPFSVYVHGKYGIQCAKPFTTEGEALEYHDKIEEVIAEAPDCPKCGKGKVLHYLCTFYSNCECKVCHECGHAPEPNKICKGCPVGLLNGGVIFK